jgi:predicted transcriptional regulator
MTLFMPIQPEPASRIYSGKKLYELRKFRPPETGFVYLYESRDETAAVQAIRGGFLFRSFLDLPLEKLWARVGEKATTREKFFRYFGPRHKSGVALVIERVERLVAPVRLEELRAIDPGFALPKGLWTYFPTSSSSPVVEHLDGLPRSRTIVHEENSPDAINAGLSVSPLADKSEEELFAELYKLYVVANYPDSEDYVDFVVRIHRSDHDRFGYFTKRKTIWTLAKEGKPIGFTVVTEKRGGSIKFGPTVIVPVERGRGVGTAFRLMVEKQYPEARKSYNTLPDDNLAALRYVIRAGYRVEAHLSEQYRRRSGELVVGKMLNPPSAFPRLMIGEVIGGDLSIVDGRDLAPDVFDRCVTNLLRHYYSEVDSGFVTGLINAMAGQGSLATKYKRVFFAMRGNTAAGIAIVTPKRGGALKCSPLMTSGEDRECMRSLLDAVEKPFADRGIRKIYIHVPLLAAWMLDTALSLGFIPEGILREPYHPGIDVIALGRTSR